MAQVEHVVFFPGPDGSASFRRVASLEAAVATVEQLHNESGVREASVHELHEVPLSFRTYVQVQVAPPAAAAPPAWEADTDVDADRPVEVAVSDLQPLDDSAPDADADAEPDLEVEVEPVRADEPVAAPVAERAEDEADEADEADDEQQAAVVPVQGAASDTQDDEPRPVSLGYFA